MSPHPLLQLRLLCTSTPCYLLSHPSSPGRGVFPMGPRVFSWVSLQLKHYSSSPHYEILLLLQNLAQTSTQVEACFKSWGSFLPHWCTGLYASLIVGSIGKLIRVNVCFLDWLFIVHQDRNYTMFIFFFFFLHSPFSSGGCVCSITTWLIDVHWGVLSNNDMLQHHHLS